MIIGIVNLVIFSTADRHRFSFIGVDVTNKNSVKIISTGGVI